MSDDTRHPTPNDPDYAVWFIAAALVIAWIAGGFLTNWGGTFHVN